MPRILESRWTPPRLEDEVVFTRSAVKAHPDTQDLTPLTDDWLPAVDSAAAQVRDVRLKASENRAERLVAHSGLGQAVMAFSRELLSSVDGNRMSSRFLGFFPESPSAATHASQSELLGVVRSWLSGFEDPTLEQHREALSGWADKLDASLQAAKELRSDRMVRDEAWAALCRRLSVERDQLHGKLRERANEHGRALSWAQSFYLRG